MAARQITIQLRVDVGTDDAKFNHLLDAAKHAAKHLISTSLLISDRPPTIAVITDDMFFGKEDIDILEDTLGGNASV